MRVKLLGFAAFAAASAALAEPLSIEQLFVAPERSAPVLSPDGTRYAAVISEGSVDRILVAPVAGGEPRELTRFDDPEERLYWLAWPKSGRLKLAGTHESAGHRAAGVSMRRTHLYALSSDDGSRREFVRRARWCAQNILPRLVRERRSDVGFAKCGVEPLPIQDEVLHLLPDDPTRVLIVYREPYPSVRRLDLATGRSAVVANDTGAREDFAADANGVVRFATSRGRDEMRLHARARADEPWRIVARYDPREPETALRFVGFTENPGVIYLLAKHAGRDALFALTIATGERTPLSAKPDASVALVRGGGSLPPVELRFDDGTRRFPDEKAAREQDLVDAQLPAAFNEIAPERTAGGARSIVTSREASGLQRWFVLDRKTGTLTRLHAERVLPETALSPTQRIGPSAQLPFAAALTRAREPGSGAAVVLVRSGPEPADLFGFDPEVQALASRGIAVLELDLVALPNGEALAWRDASADAVLAAAHWLERAEFAERGRVGAHGVGFGGYAALRAGARKPDRFAGIAALSPVTSLSSFTHESEKLQRPWPAWLEDRVERGRAIRAGDEIAATLRAPVLLGHAREALLAHVSQSRALAKALRRAERDVTYLELEGDTDELSLPENRLRFYGAWTAFFERQLTEQAPTETAATNPEARTCREVSVFPGGSR